MSNDIELPSIFRGDYEDFLRELARQLTQNLATRVDRYMASIIQVRILFSNLAFGETLKVCMSLY